MDCHSAWDGQDRIQAVTPLEDEEVIGYKSVNSSPAHLRPHFNRGRKRGLVFSVKTLEFVTSKIHKCITRHASDCPYSDSNHIVDTAMAMGGNFMSPHSEAQ